MKRILPFTLFLAMVTALSIPLLSHAQPFTPENIEKMTKTLTENDYLVVQVTLSSEASKVFIRDKFKKEITRLTHDLDAAASIAAVAPLNNDMSYEYLNYAEAIQSELNALLNQPVTLVFKFSVERIGKDKIKSTLLNQLQNGSSIHFIRNYSKISEIPIPKIYSPALDAWVPYELDPYIWCTDAMA